MDIFKLTDHGSDDAPHLGRLRISGSLGAAEWRRDKMVSPATQAADPKPFFHDTDDEIPVIGR
jgi:hypothetical protein